MGSQRRLPCKDHRLERASFVNEDGERVLGKENGLCKGSELGEEVPVMEEQKVTEYPEN